MQMFGGIGRRLGRVDDFARAVVQVNFNRLPQSYMDAADLVRNIACVRALLVRQRGHIGVLRSDPQMPLLKQSMK